MALEFVEHVDFQVMGPKLVEVKRGGKRTTVKFMAPELATSLATMGRIDLLVVDEAAAIPMSQIKVRGTGERELTYAGPDTSLAPGHSIQHH